MKNASLILLLLIYPLLFFSQDIENISNPQRKGFSLGAIPILAFDSDLGLKTGIAVNIFNYGNGEDYPKYDHSLLLKWYRTTKESSLAQIIYDSDKFIPRIRITGELSYIIDKSLDFYGFNGYQSYYNPDFITPSTENDSYISTVYYKYERKLIRFKSDFQSNIKNTNIKWLIGFSHYNIKTQAINIEQINQKFNIDDMLPDTAGLFEKYVDWGIIKEDEKDGGISNFIKAGIIYDNRDNECNCNKGIWTEAIIIYAPNILGNQSGFGKLLFTHRQYFPIKYNRLTFAYRISYQTKIWGNIPYYILPFFFDSNRTEDGLGGAKNLRGILRNRIVGNGFLLANSEIRWKFWRLKFLKQNFYLSLNTFVDAGTITNFYPVNLTDISAGYGFSLTDNLKQINHSTESIHMSYGMGLYIAMNDNFVISTDFGKA